MTEIDDYDPYVFMPGFYGPMHRFTINEDVMAGARHADLCLRIVALYVATSVSGIYPFSATAGGALSDSGAPARRKP